MIELGEMKKAEGLAKELDQSFESAIRVITGGCAPHSYPYPGSLNLATEAFKKCDFPSLSSMENKLWKKGNSKK